MESNTSDAESSSITRLDRVLLTQLVVKLLQRKGMFVAEAEIVACRMIEADQSGHGAEGVRTLPRLLEVLDLGDIDPRARLITVTETPAIAVLDGSTGMGQVAVTRAMLLAIEKAKVVGTGTVVVRNSQPCGDPGTYVRLAAEAGLIGFCTTSFGGSWLGGMSDQPFAWGLPAGEDGPVIWSKTCTRISVSELDRCRDLGLPLPEGVALDEAGQVTTNAEQVTDLVEAAPHWGLIQAHVLAVLAGGLAGGKPPFLKKKHAPFADDAEHFVLAIQPDLFGAATRFASDWSGSLGELRSGLTHGTSSPDTVPVHPATTAQLKDLAAKIKFDVTW
ncbi:MAG: Ldh family oxidoreductase [Planctomycetota bacterium]